MEIDAQTLVQKLASAQPPVVLDVRNPPEWQREGIIQGALLIPMNELPRRLAEIPEGREIVTVCHVGMRSLNAAMWLRQCGRNAVSMRGGMASWKAQRLPVVPINI